MSTQGATLRRGAVHIPILPVAAIVVAATAAVIGLSTIDATAPARTVTIVTDVERLANSSAAIREQGAALPVVWGTSHVAPKVTGFAGFENPGAYVVPAPAFAGFENPGAYVVEAPAFAGFENPGAYPAPTSESTGGASTNPCPESCQLARR